MQPTSVLFAPRKYYVLLGRHSREHLSTCLNWSPWLSAAPEIFLSTVIKYRILKTGKGKIEWELLVSFINDYTQLCDASPFCELNGCSINKLSSVRVYFESSLRVLWNESVLLQKMLITYQN